MFQYNPADALDCLPEGDYLAELSSVELGHSKTSGDQMLTLEWSVIGNNGREFKVKDYIVPKTLFKLKKIAKCLGKLQEFEASSFDLMQHRGVALGLKLSVETDDYGDKNQVKNYYAAANGATPRKPADDPFA